MLKKIFSPRNILLVFLIAAFLVIIAGQQGVLNEKRAQYDAAVAEKERIESETEELEIIKELAHSESSEESRARDSGYVYPDEIVIDYGD